MVEKLSRKERKKRAQEKRMEIQTKVYQAIKREFDRQEKRDDIDVQEKFRNAVGVGDCETECMIKENPRDRELILSAVLQLSKKISKIITDTMMAGKSPCDMIRRGEITEEDILKGDSDE